MRAGFRDPRFIADAISDFFGVPVELEQPPAGSLRLRDIPELAGPAEDSAVAIYLSAEGGLPGQFLLLFSPPGARRIGDLLLGPGADSAEVLDACRELGNVIVSRYLSQVADETGQRSIPSAPLSTVDMAGAVISSVLATMPGDPLAASMAIHLYLEPQPVHGTLILLQSDTDMRVGD